MYVQECHLCRVAGNTVRFHMACEFPVAVYWQLCELLCTCHPVYVLLLLLAGRMCGSPAVEPSLQSALSRRIVGGVEARKNSWPWQCLIQLDLGYGATRKCGGSVVDNRHVLTAAHCL